MAAKPLPHADVLRQLLRYDPETGLLYWQRRPLPLCASKRGYTIWNKRYPGTIALNSLHKDGYRHGHLMGSLVLAHRVIFKMLHGWEPLEIDHDDGDRSNNRPDNLKPSDDGPNARNQKMRSTNTSGRMGVAQHTSGRWRAWIAVKGNPKQHIGMFDTFEDACTARDRAERDRGFHPKHGRR